MIPTSELVTLLYYIGMMSVLWIMSKQLQEIHNELKYQNWLLSDDDDDDGDDEDPVPINPKDDPDWWKKSS